MLMMISLLEFHYWIRNFVRQSNIDDYEAVTIENWWLESRSNDNYKVTEVEDWRL